MNDSSRAPRTLTACIEPCRSDLDELKSMGERFKMGLPPTTSIASSLLKVQMSYNPYGNPYSTPGSSYAPAASNYGGYAAAGPAYPQAGPSYAGPSYPSAGPEVYAGGFDADHAAQQSIYTPEAAKKHAPAQAANKGKARTTVLRKGGGEIWEDPSLMEWDPGESQAIWSIPRRKADSALPSRSSFPPLHR